MVKLVYRFKEPSFVWRAALPFAVIAIVAEVFTILLPSYYIVSILSLVSATSAVIALLLILYMIGLHFAYSDGTRRYFVGFTGMLALLALIVAVFQAFLLYFPSMERSHGDESKGIEKNQIYVTYNPKCEYCEASAKNVAYAVAIYNRQHPLNQIQVVNVDDNNQDKFTPLQKELYAKQEFYGSILKVTDNGATETAYVAADAKTKDPVARSSKVVYEMLLKTNKQN